MLETETLNDLLKELGYKNIEDAAIKQVELTLLSKISKYKAENDFFRKKYNNEYSTFLKKSEIKEHEDFEIGDDLMDWKFAVEAMNKYEKQYNQLIS